MGVSVTSDPAPAWPRGSGSAPGFRCGASAVQSVAFWPLGPGRAGAIVGITWGQDEEDSR
ncbi:hypothetical protein D9753_20195 [Streptomyces dangxiongensis]|uniref:Uncharacterized protein n=1 Tax=Streptomyces dangxiongensis TaxID=1442032 RepID=A0A3G2JEQ7_9ACTN|nr:hypothetical protein D9753_20195 [Streptomyces dangxiongensis]